MKILVACEYSGVVRDAFIAKGHEAISCDLLLTDNPGPHYQGDVRDILGYPWDIVIAHPPCTDLSVSGARYFKDKKQDGRQYVSASFFMLFTKLDHVPMVAIENPVGIMSTLYRKPDQIIQPWQFGHDASKATCLWLKGLPPLNDTEYIDSDNSGHWGNQTKSGQNNLPPSKDRAKLRSKTYQGIADAMAERWGNN